MKQFSKFKQAFVSKHEVHKQDRTDVLSEDLQDAERRIELIKLACENTTSHVKKCLKCPAKDLKDLDPNKSTDRRVKHMPELLLGTNMSDTGKQIESDMKFGTALGQVLSEAGKIETFVGTKLVEYEVNIERDVLVPLQKLVENDLPNIYKTKRTLTKLTSDMDSQKARYAQASRHSMSAATPKIDTMRDDLDDTQQKWEQCRDNLAAEMYQLIARESEISQHIVNFLQAQKEFHLAAYSHLNELLPNVETVLAKSDHKPLYGKSLDAHLESSGRSIAYAIELCVCGLMVTGLEEEGLFRIAGSASKVKKLKAALDAGLLDLKSLLNEFSDPHVIANALKCYLRELPIPLLTFELHDEWMNAIQSPSVQNKLQSLWTVVQKLPKANKDNLSYLIKFLAELSKLQSVNKMTPANIAIVIGPNLLWSENKDDPAGEVPMGLNMTLTHFYTALVEQLVTYADYFFPGDADFFITYPRLSEAEMLPNGTGDDAGSSAHSEPEGMTNSKRSQSSSSLEDHSNSPPQGSPKPVVRRKNKPAPIPPAAAKIPMASRLAEQNDAPGKLADGACQRDSIPKAVSATRREGLYLPPPSPSQMNNRKSMLTTAAPTPSTSTTTISGIPEKDGPASMAPPKVTPPKPPQPQLNHFSSSSHNKDSFFYQSKDSTTIIPDNNSSDHKQPRPFGQTYSSTLRHKSSFNSGSSSTSATTSESAYTHNGSPGGKGSGGGQIGGGGGGSGSSAYYSTSLPRHFHTENSYKNQRAPRPPSIAVPAPTVPTAPPLTQPPPAVPTESSVSSALGGDGVSSHHHVNKQPVDSEMSSYATDGGPSLPTSAPSDNHHPTPASSEQTVRSSSGKSGAHQQSAPSGQCGGGVGSIGFERLEAEVSTEIELSSSNSSGGAESTKEPRGEINKEELTGESQCSGSQSQSSTASSSSSSSSSEPPRPVPAPRSSLFQIPSASKDSNKEYVPVVKDRPVVMAKPRDLAKRTTHGHAVAAGSTTTGTNASSTTTTTTSGVAIDSASSSFAGEPLGAHVQAQLVPTTMSDSRESLGGGEPIQRNGLGSSDKTLPPPSPRAPNRPPRPQPPPPPKAKTESTDL